MGFMGVLNLLNCTLHWKRPVKLHHVAYFLIQYIRVVSNLKEAQGNKQQKQNCYLATRVHSFLLPQCLIQTSIQSTGIISYYNSSSVCLCVRSLSPPRSFDRSLPDLVAVCRWTSHLPLRGSFSKRSTGRRVNGSLSLSTILYYAPASRHTAAKGAFCFAATASKSLIRAKGTFCCTASRRVIA